MAGMPSRRTSLASCTASSTESWNTSGMEATGLRTPLPSVMNMG